MSTIPESLTIARPDGAALTRTADAALAMVHAFAVDSPETYDLAAEELTSIKGRLSKLDEQRKAITKPLDDAKKAVMDLFRGPVAVLEQAEGALKGKMLTYTQDMQRKAAEARAKAEAEAQAQRDALQAEAAALAAEGRTGEAVVREQVAAMVVAVPTVAAEVPKAAGVKVSTSVDFEVVNLHALVVHAAEHPELLQLLQVDSVKLRAYVRGLGTACKLPGVRVFEKQTLAASRRG
jgi:hypothetical protein